MREIKFRAWDTNIKTMFSMKQLLLRWNTLSILTCPYFKIMQYVGLTDKNGVEIYEGDILWDDEGYCLVNYDDEGAFFRVVSYGRLGTLMENGWHEEAGVFDALDSYKFDAFCSGSEEFEVIGNIYENPELL